MVALEKGRMSIRRVSRREFIKLLGASGVAIAVGSLSFLNFSEPKKRGSDSSPIKSAAAQSSGSWIQGQNTTTVAIHASYLHSGFILYIAGSGYHRSNYDGPFEAKLLDPVTGFETDLLIEKDLFCHGSTHLANGNLLIAGGTLLYDTAPNNCNGKWHGLKDAYEYDVTTGQLNAVQSMAAGRWYPTLVTLADGKVVTHDGFDEYGVTNRLVEIYDDSAETWSIKYNPATSGGYCIGEGESCPGAGTQCFGGTAGQGVSPGLGSYPRMHLRPNGLTVICGASPVIRSHDPASGVFSTLLNMAARRHYGTSVLLPLQNTIAEKGNVLLVGGSPTSSTAATNLVEILDFNASSNNVPFLRTVQSIQYARKYLLPVILPDGKVVVFGGSSLNTTNYVYNPEMFDPVTETWTVLPAATIARTYHSVALLLSDGRVWVAGSTPFSSTWELRTEIFRPWYYTETRPTILDVPIVDGYGGNITILTPDAADIMSVSLVRLMSTTHHYDANQRFVWLQILNKTSNSVVVAAPLNGNIAPPGYYMIHVLNSAGVPSQAKMVKIPGTGGGDIAPPGQVTGLAVTPAGSSQLNLAWNVNPEPDVDHYDVHRDTVSGFTPSPANRIAQPTSTSYSDTGLSSSTTYYYVVAAVDTASNIGPASSEVAGTTDATGGETFYDVAFPGNAIGGIYTGSSIRYGEEALTSSSVLVGKSLKIWKVYLRKAGSPSGNVTAVVRRASDDAVVATFNETLNAASLPTSFAEQTFTLTAPYVIQTGDRILIQYSGPSRVDISVLTPDQIDGSSTRRTRYTGSSYIGGNTADIVGSMTSGAGGDITPPGQVTGLAVTPAGSSQLNLAWNVNPEPDVDHYDVHRDTVSGFTPSPANRIAQPTSTSYSDTGLSSSTTYYYVVAAVDTASNIGPASSEVAGTTDATGGETFYDVAFPGNAIGGIYTGSSIRYGEEARISSSLIVGKSLKRWTVYLRKAGSPSGNVTAVVRRASDDAVVATFNETLNAASLPTSFAPFDFTLSSAYVIQSGDRLLVEYGGASRVDISVWTSDQFDGDRTRRTRYTGTSYNVSSTNDTVGKMSTE